MILSLILLIGLVACQQGEQGEQGGTETSSSGWTTGQSEAVPADSTAAAGSGGQPNTSTAGQQAAGGQATATGGWGNAPDFNYRTFDGQSGRLSDHFGKPVVVNFWAAWCPPCKQEMPHFDESFQQHAGGFELLAIAVDPNNDPAAYFAAQGFSFTGGMDVDGAAHYLGGAIPVTAFIDRQGNLVHRQDGMMTREQFESHLKKIL
jgi:thiol-disulfide isomerase/thioredoxin